jgi:hypothetical protein
LFNLEKSTSTELIIKTELINLDLLTLLRTGDDIEMRGISYLWITPFL